MKYIILGIIAVLFLAACSSAPAETDALPAEPSAPVIEEPQEVAPVVSSDLDVQIINGRLEPREVTVAADTEVQIAFHNEGDRDVRVDILLRPNPVSETVPAGGYSIVTVEASAGRYSIDLNNQQLGTLTVQ